MDYAIIIFKNIFELIIPKQSIQPAPLQEQGRLTLLDILIEIMVTKTNLAMLLFTICIVQISFGQVTKVELQRQPDNRIYIRLGYESESSFGSQQAGAYVKNNTSDDLGIKLLVSVRLTCGSTFSYNPGIGGVLTLKGNKETDPSFWFDSNFMSREIVKEYEKICGKRKEGQKSVISGISCSLISIENYSQKERDKQAQRDKEAAEHKLLAEQKARKEAEGKRNETVRSGITIRNSEMSGSQQKNENNASLERQGELAREKFQEEQNRKAQETIVNIRKREQESIARRERSNAYMQQASFYGTQAFYAKEMRVEASSFQKIHTDLSSLEADYNAKISQLAEASEREIEATSATYAAAASGIAEAGWGNSSISQSAGQLGAAIGGIVATNRANKARKELLEEKKRQERAISDAIAKAKRERIEAEQKLRAEAERLRKQGIISLRQQLIKTFIDGGLPLRKNNINQEVVYLFAYSSSKNDWNIADSAQILVSNIIPVYKLIDDTYPYKKSVLKELSALGNESNITLIGFFTDKNEVEEIRENFISSVKKADFTVKNVEVNINRIDFNPDYDFDDFWETGKTSEKNILETSETIFWN